MIVVTDTASFDRSKSISKGTCLLELRLDCDCSVPVEVAPFVAVPKLDEAKLDQSISHSLELISSNSLVTVSPVALTSAW